MRKTLVIVGVLIVMSGMLAVAFGGGVLVGRLSCHISSNATSSTSPIAEITSKIAGNDDETVQLPDAEHTATNNGEIGFDDPLIQDVLDILGEQFYGEIPGDTELTYGAIRGMLITLDDPYTSFVEPKTAAILNEDASGEFEGIGATVRMREDGYLEVVRPLPGHPAEEAGIQAGDLILSVNDQSIIGLGLYEAISYVRGPAGSEANLEIARPGEADLLYITVIRARIELPIVEYRMLDNDIAYILLTSFDSTATDRVEDALKDLQEESPRGLIFDLRNNGGGYLDQAIKVSDLFLDEGLVAIKRDSSGDEEKYYAFDGDLGEDIPMVVLVNGGSASASEIVAGAFQDRERAPLLGETTLGKGSVQLLNNLRDGSQLRVTVARWYTPNDRVIHNEGLAPDIEAPYPADTPAGEDPQLDRAIEYLETGK
ncbi:MAG: S41 family peptidase [Anaerolineae bacterium]|nr:S41 family peptidase [Anaerolineae bacterium]